MSPEEFERIKWASQVLTKEELEARVQAFKKEKEAALVANPSSPGPYGWEAERDVLGRGQLPLRRGWGWGWGSLVRGPWNKAWMETGCRMKISCGSNGGGGGGGEKGGVRIKPG